MSIGADRMLLLQDGRLIAEGEPQAVLTPERLKAVDGVQVAVEQLSRGQIVCVPDYDLPRA